MIRKFIVTVALAATCVGFGYDLGVNIIPPESKTEPLGGEPYDCTEVEEILVSPEKLAELKRPSYLSDEVPLSDELQTYLYDVCETYGVPYTLALGIIEVESSFRADAVNCYGNCFGYMQIHECNEASLKSKIGITSIKDPKDNLKSGVYMISKYIEVYGTDYHRSLICYNYGVAGANANVFSKGIYQTEYSKKVYECMNKWQGVVG